ncbi:AAA domain-containing protein [Infundibulicybe gibba]|nr:AAA domain-containing protein [Infundibulicybe gibba]
MAPQRRLNQLLKELEPSPEPIGTLTLGGITYDIPQSLNPSKLPRSRQLLDIHDAVNTDNLHFMLQKYLLGQDIFLISQPGPYARRLALTFSSLINAEYEYIALHRDVGETELKQGREIRKGGSLVYVDSPAVRAAKHGRLLILEGIEKAERGIMPVLNNLLENREMNLDDGTHIIHPHRFAQLEANSDDGYRKMFIPAHRNFRVIAIAAPVPPYPGYPLDPPFRSRFQARFVDPIGSLTTLRGPHEELNGGVLPPLFEKIRDIILSTQIASESRNALEPISNARQIVEYPCDFPPPEMLSPGHLARLFLTIHPGLIHAPFQAWALLSRQVEDSDLGELGSPSIASADEELGLLGYRATSVSRVDDSHACVTFQIPGSPQAVSIDVPAGKRQLRAFPWDGPTEFHATPRFMGLLTCFLQAHALGWDISLIPPASPSTASTSTSTLVNIFGQILGYEIEGIHMYKELGGREMIMRRRIEDGGATTWEPSPLIEGAWAGRLVHLSGLDVIGSTAGSLSRLIQDRETELWENRRMVAEASPEELSQGELSIAHPSFRIISTSSKSLPVKDWLSDEHANMFFPVPSQPMDADEEFRILSSTGCPSDMARVLIALAEQYRRSISNDNVLKNRKLGTRTLVRIARRLALFPQEDINTIIRRSLLADFLPAMERLNLDNLLEESGIRRKAPEVGSYCQGMNLVFPGPSSTGGETQATSIPSASRVPHMDNFYDNSIQTGLMRDLAIDLELLGEHVVLLGNQGVGKNKILLSRPREYIQLHRDTTVNQLMFTTSLEGGIIHYTDSPLLKAIMFGRVIIIDEADKAPEHVVAIFRSLAGQSEMTLSDGRRVRSTKEREGDIPVHPNFRLVLLLTGLATVPFLGNHFLQVLGEGFSAHSISNPDQDSERKLLGQLAPELDDDLILRLVGAFQDLRTGYDSGLLTYPYSLRVSTTQYLDFDVYKHETIDKLAEILQHHGLRVTHLGLDAAREIAKKTKDIQFEPKNTELGEPKEGVHDDKEHHGGNTYAGGVSDALKSNVPDHIKEKAREMARQELKRRLEELDMSASEAKGYGELLAATQAHMLSLHDLLEHLAAKEEERVWVKRQTDGELDDSRLTEGLTGEATVYKRRGMEKPELGRPQIKPKRIRFRFQYDGRLKRSMEAAAMLMETFDRLSHKEKYVWDSGDGADILLVDAEHPPSELKDRWKVVEKMLMIPQYAFAGDFTVEAIETGVNQVGKFDADDWFVIAITDANFGRYQISPEELTRAMNRNPKVHTALICIGEGAEASWITKRLPGRGFRVVNTADIPIVLRSILSTMIDS